jgi:hypothetical protein
MKLRLLQMKKSMGQRSARPAMEIAESCSASKMILEAEDAKLGTILRSRALTENERELQNVALILAEQMEHDFGAVESVQINLFERLQAFGIVSSEDYERKMSGYDNHLVLKDKIVGLHHLGTVTLVNSQGKVFNFSRSWPIPEISVADRDFFTVLQSDEKLNSVISKPIRNRATGT